MLNERIALEKNRAAGSGLLPRQVGAAFTQTLSFPKSANHPAPLLTPDPVRFFTEGNEGASRSDFDSSSSKFHLDEP